MSEKPAAPMSPSPAHKVRPATDLQLPRAWRVDVRRKDPALDAHGAALGQEAKELEIQGLTGLVTVRGTLLSSGYSRSDVERIARELLSDPVVDVYTIAAPGEAPTAPPKGAVRITVAPQPGVMDPVARSVAALLERAGPRPASGPVEVATFRAFEVQGKVPAPELQRLGRRLLANETIDTLRIGTDDLPFRAPAGGGKRGAVNVPLLGLSDRDLEQLSKSGQLSLNLVEMRAVQAHYLALGREPTAVELETLAQTWSEHCKHKVLTGQVDFRGQRIDNVLKSTIARATRELDRKDFCLSVFVDNAGVIALDEEWALGIKVETHNHPSAIDPYGGAGTGIGGVIRDILGVGLGAKPIANTDAFFVGPLDLAAADVPKGSLHPKRVLRGVVAGVRDYGNRMGIPTVSGGLWFHRDYTANPLVYAGTLGLLPRKAVNKRVAPGDWIVAVGGRTGRDGIHGATFSSIELNEASETESSHAVQIGDPITEKGVLDCLLVARDRGLYRGVTDCGAGGFSSAVGEMGAECGAEVWLERVPLKYPGLASHEVWISEAQERMVLAVPPENLDELLALFAAEEVEAVAIGKFTDSGRLVLRDGAANNAVESAGQLVGDLDMHFLHEGTPRPLRSATWTTPDVPEAGVPTCKDVGRAVLAALAHPNVTSRAWILRQYDHEVQGGTVIKPLVGTRGDGPGDGAVLQPLPHSTRGAALGLGANPNQGRLDPYNMALASIDEALRGVVAVGGDPGQAALLDNFSWGNCDKPENLGALVLAAQACYDAAIAFRAPFVSGKDSLNNEYRVGDRTLSIPPTLLITALAIVPDVSRAVTMDLAKAGDGLYLVGETSAEFGGSVWLEQNGRALEDGFRAPVPRPDLERAPKLFAALHGAIRAGLVRAVHDLSEGGLGVAVAESAFAGDLGAHIDLARVPVAELPKDADHDTVALFSESTSRFLVEVAPEHAEAFQKALSGLPVARIGEVLAEAELRIDGARGKGLAKLNLDSLRQAHRGHFQG